MRFSMLALFVCSLISSLLLFFRFYYTSADTYLFLSWNLFLAWIPFVLAILIGELYSENKSKITLLILGIMWFIFYPNALYVITDFIHLKERFPVPVWFDFLLILLFALTSMFAGFISMSIVQNIIHKTFGKTQSWIFVWTVTVLSSFGIYLGRFLRWNSWDVIVNPTGVTLDIVDRIIHPLSYPPTIVFTVLFSLFSIITYYFFTLSPNSKKIISAKNKAIRSKEEKTDE